MEELEKSLNKLVKKYEQAHSIPQIKESSSGKKEKFYLLFNPKNLAQSEVEKYFSEPLVSLTEKSDALAFWRLRASDYPVLHRIAVDFLSIPASGSIVEKKFSVASNLTAD